MAFIRIGQKRHTVSELVSRYKSAKSDTTRSRVKITAEMFLSCKDLEKFNKKIL